MDIVARAGSDSGEHRLTTAGANRVISPYRIAGRRMALAATQPLIQEIVDLFAAQRPEGEQLFAELGISEDAAALPGRTVGAVLPSSDRTRVLGLLRADGEFIAGPAVETPLQSGDRLMIFGGRVGDSGDRAPARTHGRGAGPPDVRRRERIGARRRQSPPHPRASATIGH